ncbi:MAG: HAD family hydrolase [Acidobacteria bacterium]|nr:HAD family hydrolase [Acidobacteriota bacterium]
MAQMHVGGRAAVFLDRDGTINEDVGYLTDVGQLRIYPFAADAIRLLRRAGFAIVVVTNQGGVARGLMTAAFVEETHRRVAARLDRAGAHVDDWLYCPHHPEAVVPELSTPCACRKPGTAMPLEAAARHGIDLARSWVIGDHWRDVQMGHAVGARAVLLRTGHGRDQETWRPEGQRVEAICDNLMAAAAFVLGPGLR